jgi:hypothetical protein
MVRIDLSISVLISILTDPANPAKRRCRIPFYSWIRLFALSYLVLPQTQGATRAYLEYVEPFLIHHEREIEDFIGRSHERAKAAGLQQLYRLIDLVREKVLGLPPLWSAGAAAAPPAAGGPASYAQALFSRFGLPTPAATTFTSPAGELYSLLSSVLAPGAAKARDPRTGLDLDTGILPRELASAPRSEQAQYISSVRERLGYLLSVVDRQREDLELDRAAALDAELEEEDDENDDLAYGTSYEVDPRGLRKNRSENSFENIDPDDIGISSSLDRDGHPEDVYYERRSRRR